MSSPEIRFETSGRTGAVILDRPNALNALTLDMVNSLYPKLLEWSNDETIGHIVVSGAGDKAFCAGGDIRALYDWGRAGDARAIEFYRLEYRLNTLIGKYPKPYIALMDGITMGGGVGLSIHGTVRIGTERLMFAMPETGIGLFPDVGGSYFLPRCPGETGMYLALTGDRLSAEDAHYTGLIDHIVPSGDLDTLALALNDADNMAGVIGIFAVKPAPSRLEALQDRIDRVFSGASVEDILERLAAEDDQWSRKVHERLRAKSPTSLKITHRQIRNGAALTFEQCMKQEFRMINRVMAGHDFYEGTRAVVIDKDNAPKWQPATLGAVDVDHVSAYFAPLQEELELTGIGG